MSRRGNCWDNASQESFFGHLKDEANITAYATFEELIQEIDEYRLL
ncbi:transposase InsO family protein [Clostridium saccharobutylicum]|nr:transposase InsO family protein [Clostridium saccharobutylicum]